MYGCEFMWGVGVGPQVLRACRESLAWRRIPTSDAQRLEIDGLFIDVGNTDTRREFQKSTEDILLTRSQLEAMCVLSFISGPQAGVTFWPETHPVNDVDKYRDSFAVFAVSSVF